MPAHRDGSVFFQLRALFAVAPRELYVVYVLKFLESIAYFSSSINLTLYLTVSLGFSDASAGFIYSAWGVVTGVSGIACGPYVDRFGVQRSLLFGGVVLTLGRLFFVVAPANKPLALLGLLILQPLGMGLAIPVLTICVRRIFAHHPPIAHMRPLAYGVFYSVMNVAALCGGLVTDALLSAFSTTRDAGDGEALRRVFAVGAAVSSLYCLVATFFYAAPPPRQACIVGGSTEPEFLGSQNDAPATGSWVWRMFHLRERRAHLRGQGLPGGAAGGAWPGFRAFLWSRLGPLHGGQTPLRETAKAPTSGGCGNECAEESCETEEGASSGHDAPWWALLRDRTLWKISILSVILFGSRSVFRHVDATLPKYLRRTLGASARYGLVYAINPALIIFCVPPVQAFISARNFDLYLCIFWGSLAGALAPFAFVLFEGFLATHSYLAAVAFMLLLTAGEAISAPISYEFFMRVAPAGREGVYGSLASAPIFFVKLFVGTMSGNLLQDFCAAPPPGQGHLSPQASECWRVWAVIGAMACTTPALLALLRGWLYSEEIKRKVQR